MPDEKLMEEIRKLVVEIIDGYENETDSTAITAAKGVNLAKKVGELDRSMQDR